MGNFDFSLQVLAKSMTLRLNKHAAIASNIANADTPGYRPKDVSFEAQLQKAVGDNSTSDLDRVKPRVETVDDKVPRLDGNSVNLEKQMADLTNNSLLYVSTAQFIKSKIGMLRDVIS